MTIRGGPGVRIPRSHPRCANRSGSLPLRLANVIGRDEVLDALTAKLRLGRLVTIVGPGGIGKTTVAIALAERIARRQPNGAVFVDLAPIGDPALVAVALAAAIGVSAAHPGTRGRRFGRHWPERPRPAGRPRQLRACDRRRREPRRARAARRAGCAHPGDQP